MPTPKQFTIPIEGPDGRVAGEVLVTRRRKTGAVVRAYPDGRITLSVPRWFTKAQATAFVRDHRERILAQAASVAPSPRERAYREALARLAEGDIVPVWGRDATVVHRDSAAQTIARLERGALVLSLPPAARGDDPDARALRRRAVERLYRRELADRLPALKARCEEALDVRTGRWTIRLMRSRWGSCRWETGSISINLDLATHDPAHLENVALHETCHMLAHNHGPQFKALMDRVSPNWRSLDKALASEGVRLA